MTQTVTLSATKAASTTDHKARSLAHARKLAGGLIAAGLADSVVIYQGMNPVEKLGI